MLRWQEQMRDVSCSDNGTFLQNTNALKQMYR